MTEYFFGESKFFILSPCDSNKQFSSKHFHMLLLLAHRFHDKKNSLFFDEKMIVCLFITDYGVLWSTAVKKLSQFLEFQVYVDLFGREGAQRMFRRHVKKLKDDYLNSKVQRYFDVLPEVLHQLFPEFETFTEE